jgi:hypothetical protein
MVENKDAPGEKNRRTGRGADLGTPSDGLQVRSKGKYVVQYAATSTQWSKTIQVRDSAGNFEDVSVETQKSDRPA